LILDSYHRFCTSSWSMEFFPLRSTYWHWETPEYWILNCWPDKTVEAVVRKDPVIAPVMHYRRLYIDEHKSSILNLGGGSIAQYCSCEDARVRKKKVQDGGWAFRRNYSRNSLGPGPRFWPFAPCQVINCCRRKITFPFPSHSSFFFNSCG
jgi:hypothetical protein